MSTCLHTYVYKKLLKEIRDIIPLTGIVSQITVLELGLLHERALYALEEGKIREDEFEEIRSILRGYGLTELFY